MKKPAERGSGSASADVAAVALNETLLASWSDLNGPNLPDEAAIEGGWLESFVSGAVEVYESL
ncbi:hypothetical protein [Falsiroseomonas tokyonensis]|nr:hypothetical protein [Falsiroseomonas tokyonensis]